MNITRKTRSVKMTLEFIKFAVRSKLSDKEIEEKLKAWLENSYEMAKSDGIIETLERQYESNTR